MAKVWEGDRLINLLARRYPAPGYALLQEVRDSTGYGAKRSADALVMGLYPSRGLYLYGFELKSDRIDWLREKKNPAKADMIAKYCHYWYLVAGSKEVAKVEEMPETWGLLVAEGSRLIERKKAAQMAPEALDYRFLAAILRRACELVDHHDKKSQATLRNNKLYQKGYEKGKEDGRESGEIDSRIAKHKLEGLEKSLREFEEKSGIKIHEYGGHRIGEAVDTLMRSRETPKELDDLAESLEETAGKFRDRAQALKARNGAPDGSVRD